MKAWVQYYQPSAMNTDQLFPVCGDRGVVVLDARERRSTWLEDADACNGWRRPQYPGWRVYYGPKLFDESTARIIGQSDAGMEMLDG